MTTLVGDGQHASGGGQRASRGERKMGWRILEIKEARVLDSPKGGFSFVRV